MSVRRSNLLVPFLVFAVLSSYACDDGTVTRIGPTRVPSGTRFLNSAITVRQFEINAVPVSGALCPTVPPLLAPVDLVITGDRTTDVRLRQVQMQFVDASGIIGGFRSFDDRQLATMFGSAFFPALATQTLPFSFPFGCSGGRVGTLRIGVTAADGFGRESRTSLQVPVR